MTNILEISFFAVKKKYKTYCKRQKRNFKQDILNQLEYLESEHPEQYWRLLENLRRMDQEESNSCPIAHDQWVKHYQNLFSKINEDHTADIDAEIKQRLTTPNFNELDFRISADEIIKAIKQLKNNKAVGMDNISGEIIKCSSSFLICWYEKIFNFIYDKSHYPDAWRTGMITNLYKKGDREDPNNYRGLTITSCMSKVFSTILNNRLEKFLVGRNIIKPHQIGFRKGARTADHLFIIKTLIEKSLKTKRNLFICFIDFEKAYDSVWHKALILKLLRHGIADRFTNIMQNIYSCSQSCVKLGGTLGPEFVCSKGVRQGDVLSPSLFNIFVNDIPDVIKETNNTPCLGDQPIGCLLYADDLVIMSHELEDLQKKLFDLQDYCNRWHLKVNTKKTKIIRVGKGNHHNLVKKITINDEPIDFVNSHPYLGIAISSDGKMDAAQRDVRYKALKAIFKIRSVMSGCDLTPKLNLQLFDKLIKPICLYGSEIWAESLVNNTVETKCSGIFERAENKLIERLHIKYCKIALGVHNKSTNKAVMGELGRYPLTLDVLVQIVKFFIHVNENKNNSPLLEAALTENLGTLGKSKKTWINIINNIVTEAGYNLKNLSSKSIPYIKKHLQKVYDKLWFDAVQNQGCKRDEGKLSTYRQIKFNFKMEEYLTSVRVKKHREALTKMRISAHRFAVETGRYTRPPTPRCDRICQYCRQKCNENIVENEFHIVTECPRFNEPRDKLYTNVISKCPNFATLNKHDKFIYLMTCEGIFSQYFAVYCSQTIS